MNRIFILTLLIVSIFSCKENKLPILGHRYEENGKTIYSQIPEFILINQNGDTLTRDSLRGKIHVADFFFTSCPTICPKVMRGMMEIEETFRNNPKLAYLCFSIDYKRDSVPRLLNYYTKLGLQNPNFHLLTGPTKEAIDTLADDYMSIANEDPDVPGGFDHSGYILLVDNSYHIRAYALGTDANDVKRLINDINLLLKETN
jgi:protein SCO1/2